MIFNREKKVKAVYSSIESELTLLGAIAVEDKLQENVRETLVRLGAAGIKGWSDPASEFVGKPINIGGCRLRVSLVATFQPTPTFLPQTYFERQDSWYCYFHRKIAQLTSN